MLLRSKRRRRRSRIFRCIYYVLSSGAAACVIIIAAAAAAAVGVVNGLTTLPSGEVARQKSPQSQQELKPEKMELLPCPSTKWNLPSSTDDLLSSSLSTAPRRSVPFLTTITRPQNVTTPQEELKWIKENSHMLIDEILDEHGAILFKGYQLPKSKTGFSFLLRGTPTITNM